MENNLNCLVNFIDDTVIINAHLIIKKDYTVTGKDLILDIFTKHYNNQNVVIYTYDGENLVFSGFAEFVKFLQFTFNIPNEKITWKTQDLAPTGYSHEPQFLEAFFQTRSHIAPEFSTDLTGSKFVGLLAGRANITRFRLAYEVDRAFPGDNYTVFQPTVDRITELVKHTSDFYKDELNWLSNKKFDEDLKSSNHSAWIDWRKSCYSYGNLWNKFQIEIVSETDVVSSVWFTEKTARCISTGKPFVLVCGTGSLANLRNLGFETFGSVLDESYDNCSTPTKRIEYVINSLKELYNSPDREDKIKQLYKIAERNILVYERNRNGNDYYQP